jgi:glycosyltransferase involved in cell wall biosynthesis
LICPAGALLIYGRSKYLKNIYNFLIGKKILRNAQRVIAITSDEITQIKSHGIPSERIALIPNGIDPDNYREKDDAGFRKKYGLGAYPLILFLGGLRAIKGPDLLLEAFIHIKDDFKDHHLVFIGHDRGSLNELQQTVASQKVEDRVHFIGYVDGAWKSKAYHAADLLVIPSRHEAMSIVILEAGITATPVLVTDRCGLNEIPQIGGGLVVAASAESLKTGLRKLLAAPEQLEKMGANLYSYVTDNLIWDVVISKYIELYGKILHMET